MHSTWRAARELAQLLADRARRGASDTGVDLVEHDRRGAVRAEAATLISASITRDSSPPEAISRSGPAGTPGFGRDQELDRIAPAAPEAVQRALARAGSRSRRDLNVAPSIASSPSCTQDRLLEAARPPCSRAAGSSTASREPATIGAVQLLLQPAGLAFGVGEPVAVGAAALGVLEHRRDRAAVLALQTREPVESLLHLRQPAGIRLQALQVRAQLAAQLLRLVRQRSRSARPARRATRRAPAARPSSASAAREALERPRRRLLVVAGSSAADAAGRGVAQRLHGAQARALGSSSRLLLLGGRDLLDLARSRTRAGRGRARACRPARAAPPARARARRAAASSRSKRRAARGASGPQ